MVSDDGVARAVKAGNDAFQLIMELDRKKAGRSQAELEEALTRILMAFVRIAGLPMTASVKFSDVHGMMKKRWHSELSVVQIDGSHCTLNYHECLISYTSQHAGFVFIAKSWVILLVIGYLLQTGADLNAQFVFEIGDQATLDQVAFCSNNPKACLILDDEFAATAGYAAYRETSIAQALPWDAREAKILWRGSTTGKRMRPAPPNGWADDLSWLPRLAFCQAVATQGLADICDVGISRVVQIDEPYLVKRIEDSGLIRPGVPRARFAQMKGAFDIDGNSNAWSGLFCSLLGGSCVLKVESFEGFRQWYYPSLAPWRDFIPVRSDFSDLAEIVRWFSTHDLHAAQIAARGQELAMAIDIQSAVQKSATNLVQWLKQRT
jgi:hypothetical protein